MKFTTDVSKAAHHYDYKKWQVAALGSKTKHFKSKGKIQQTSWEEFVEGDNIGILSRNGLTVIDLDAAESVVLADYFLPDSKHIWGREGKLRAKRLFRTKIKKLIQNKDLINKETLSEIRVNHMDMAPPSIHPDGTLLEWDILSDDEVVTIEDEELIRSIQKLDTCSMVLRYYPEAGSRHYWMLGVTGLLRQIGLTEEETLLIIKIASKIKGDNKLKDREDEVTSTYRILEENIKGAQGIIEEDENGANFVKTIRNIWKGSKSSTDFEYTQQGTLVSRSQDNIELVLKRFSVELSFNAFKNIPMYRKGDNKFKELIDKINMRFWFKSQKAPLRLKTDKGYWQDAVYDLAYQNSFHPVRDYLDNLKWDGVERINKWLITYGKAVDTELIRSISSIVLMAAVRRVREPGCKFDEMLVLESPQGWGKSTAIKALSPYEEWISEDLPLNSDSKKVIEKTQGIWIIEASELGGLSERFIEHVKSFLSRQVDGPARGAYAHLPESVPRQFIIIGTTNSNEYWNDPTGGRRFWPVRVGRFDVAALARDRDQLWAEASAREMKRESIRLPQRLWKVAALEQTLRQHEDPWLEFIKDAIKTPPPDWFTENYSGEKTKCLRITQRTLFDIIGIAREFQGKKESIRLSSIMKQLKFIKSRIRDPVTKESGLMGWTRDFDAEDLEHEPEQLKLKIKENES